MQWKHEGCEKLKMVEVMGTWDGWLQRTQLTYTPGQGWSGKLELEPGRYAFKYILDDTQWTHSESLPKQFCAVGVFNNALEVEGPPPLGVYQAPGLPRDRPLRNEPPGAWALREAAHARLQAGGDTTTGKENTANGKEYNSSDTIAQHKSSWRVVADEEREWLEKLQNRVAPGDFLKAAGRPEIAGGAGGAGGGGGGGGGAAAAAAAAAGPADDKDRMAFAAAEALLAEGLKKRELSAESAHETHSASNDRPARHHSHELQVRACVRVCVCVCMYLYVYIILMYVCMYMYMQYLYIYNIYITPIYIYIYIIFIEHPRTAGGPRGCAIETFGNR